MIDKNLALCNMQNNQTSNPSEGCVGQSTGHSSTAAIALCLSLLLFSVYSLSYSGLLHSSDEMSVLSVTESLVKYGGFDTNQIIWERWSAEPMPTMVGIPAGPFSTGTASGHPNSQGAFGRDGNLYSKKGIGTSLLAAPLYWIALEIPGIGLAQTTMLLNNMITACTGAILFLYVKRLGYLTSTSLIVSLLFGLSTMAWPYSKFLFSEPVVAFTLFLAAYLLLLFREDPTSLLPLIGATISLGVTLATKINNIVVIPLFFLYSMLPPSKVRGNHRPLSLGEQLRKRLPSGLMLILLVLVMLIPICLYNLFRYGNILQSGYHPSETFSNPLQEGLYGLLFSPDKSLFIYSPILLLSIASLPAFFKRHPAEASLGLSVFASYCLLFAKWHAWSGGLAWGPRFLVPAIPFLMPWLAPAVELVLGKRSPLPRLGFSFLSTLSIAVQLLGVSVNFRPYLFFLPPDPSWTAPRRWPILAPILGGCPSCLSPDILDFAWFRVSAGRVSVDGLLVISSLVLVLLFSLGIYYFSHREASKRALILLTIGGITLSLGLAWLFLSRCYKDHRFGGGDDYHALLGYLQDVSHSQDTLVLTNHTYTNFFLNYNKSRLNWYGLTWREQPLAAETVELLEELVSRYLRIWLVVDHVRALRLPSPVEEWLSQRAYKIDEKVFSDYARLCLYSTIDAPSDSPQIVTASKLGDSIQLVGYDLNDLTSQSETIHLHPGEALRLSLLWQSSAPLQEDHTVFVQLLGPDGRLWWQRDSYPADGLRPTTSWQVSEEVRDNYVVEIPLDAPPGKYHLVTGMYSLATMERLPVTTAQQVNVGDHILLGKIVVAP
jgi:hypothetical protein